MHGGHKSVPLMSQIDMIGLLLFIGGFGMFFVTITLANSPLSNWGDSEFFLYLHSTHQMPNPRGFDTKNVHR